jgi:hypothetical protein
MDSICLKYCGNDAIPYCVRGKGAAVTSRILIAGSGKIARDAGVYFLKKGNAVTWVSRNESCLIDLQGFVDNEVRMFMTQSRGSIRQISASFSMYDELEPQAFDIIIECTAEDLDEKKDVISRLANHVKDPTVLVTTSLALPPSDIHPACLGFRVRYPLEHLKSAEVAFPAGATTLRKETLLAFCKANDITCVG